MNKELVEKLFSTLFPEITIEIKSFEILKRNFLNESNQWVEDTPAIFIGVCINGSTSSNNGISETMSLFTGYEINVFIS